MYTEGLQVGDNSYLLQDEDELVLATIEGTPEQMEEYIQTVNEYDKKREEKWYLTDRLSEIHDKDKNARIINIVMLIITICSEGLVLPLSIMSGSFPMAVFILGPIIPVICFGAGAITNYLSYGTKKKREEQKQNLGKQILKIKKEQKELKKQIDILKKQIEYSEMSLDEEEIVLIRTIENKKTNVKMRVLRLNQSR